MTLEKLIYKFLNYNIPLSVRLMSDSGWECNETDMDGIYYNKKLNVIVFRQDISEYETKYTKENGWELLL